MSRWRSTGVALVLVCLLASCGDRTSQSALVPAPSAERPSQTAAAATRDGVVPALAKVALIDRSDRRGALVTPEGTWVISQPTDALSQSADNDSCAFGDRQGTYGVDFICPSEYGEVLLIAGNDVIRRAFPMPTVPPSWLYATERAIFGGRVGDGCLPNSTLFRIDRTSLKLTLILFPQGDLATTTVLPSWRVASKEETVRLAEVVGTERGVQVTSALGALLVDIEGVEQMFSAPSAGPGVARPSGC